MIKEYKIMNKNIYPFLLTYYTAGYKYRKH